MGDAIHVAKLNDGADNWNTWRADRNFVIIDLTDESFVGRDFTNFDLRFSNFGHAHLRGAKFGGTRAWNANFSFADLYKANFEGCDLPDSNFNEADIFDASFRDANLRCADLSNAHGALRIEQMAGANLTAAKLPESLSRLLANVDTVKSISESARNLLFALLAACFYSCLTISTTTDVNLITNHASSPLPIIQTSIPIVAFYFVTPLLLLGFYFYFHVYLQKLWEELASLPAVFQDGRPLHAKVDPWLMNELVRSHFSNLKVERPFLSFIQLWISVLLAWWVVPITMFLFWARYLRRHEWYGTIFHIATLTIAIVSAWCLYRLAVATLCRTDRPPFGWKKIFTSPRVPQMFLIAVVGLSLFGILSLGAIRGSLPRDTSTLSRVDAFVLRMQSLIPTLMSRLGYHPFADLSGQDVSVKKANWTGGPDEAAESVTGAQLKGVDLRNARMERAFLVEADLSNADLTNVFLVNADLMRVQLLGARLADANFYNADLRGANLSSVDFSNGFLRGADLSRADLGSARLVNTNLIDARLNDAQLHDAILTGAELTKAKLIGANLAGANLIAADLTAADLTGADLTSADLAGARLRGTLLKFSDLRKARNVNAAQIRSANAWDQAFYDAEMLAPLGLDANHNKKVKEQLDSKSSRAVARSLPRP